MKALHRNDRLPNKFESFGNPLYYSILPQHLQTFFYLQVQFHLRAMSRVVLITGATSGIGKDVAKRLAAEGWKVVVSGRRKEAGQQVSSRHYDCYVPAQFAHRT